MPPRPHLCGSCILTALGALFFVMSACDSEQAAPGPEDAAADEVADGFAEVGSPLTEPDPPVLTPCPQGWREVAPLQAGDPVTCDPWPETGPDDCGEDEAQFPGTTGCAIIGNACSEGEWPSNLPTDSPILYVRAGAAAGGTGTAEAPLDLADAAMLASPGTVIALGKGSYAGVELPTGVTLWGACVAETSLSSTEPFDASAPSGTLVITGQDVVVRNLRLGGTDRGILVAPGASATIRDVLVLAATHTGIYLQGRAAIENVVVRQTQSADTGYYNWLTGVGLAAEGAESVSLDHVVVEGSHWFGVSFGAVQSVQVSDTVVRATHVLPEEQFLEGTALTASGVEELTVTRTAIEGNPGVGIFLIAPPEASVRLTDVVVRGADEVTAQTFGGGIMIQGEPDEPPLEILLERTLVEHARILGITAYGADIALTDVVIRDILPYGADDRTQWGGFGLAATGAQVELTRVAILRTMAGGVWLNDTPLELEKQAEGTNDGQPGCLPTQLNGSDVAVWDTLPMQCATATCPDGSFGMGVIITGDCSALTLERFRVSRSALAGLQLAGGTADLSQGVVSNNPIGVNLQTPDFDVTRLEDGVFYLENEQDLDTAALPIPDLAQFLDF